MLKMVAHRNNWNFRKHTTIIKFDLLSMYQHYLTTFGFKLVYRYSASLYSNRKWTNYLGTDYSIYRNYSFARYKLDQTTLVYTLKLFIKPWSEKGILSCTWHYVSIIILEVESLSTLILLKSHSSLFKTCLEKEGKIIFVILIFR